LLLLLLAKEVSHPGRKFLEAQTPAAVLVEDFELLVGGGSGGRPERFRHCAPLGVEQPPELHFVDRVAAVSIQQIERLAKLASPENPVRVVDRFNGEKSSDMAVTKDAPAVCFNFRLIIIGCDITLL
jgi:hypothetical protein